MKKSISVFVVVLALACTAHLVHAQSNTFTYQGALADKNGLGKSQPPDYTVWVLHNLDPDYQTPPFGDTLTIFNSHGEILQWTDGLNIAQRGGHNRRIQVDLDGRSALVAEVHNLRKWTVEGVPVWSVPYGEWGLQALGKSKDGYVYAIDVGTIHGQDAFKIWPVDGTEVSRSPHGGVDLVVDDDHNSIWVVGSSLKKLTRDLELQLSVDEIEHFSQTLDYDSMGSVWYAQRGSGDLYRNALDKVSPQGMVIVSIDLSSMPTCVAIDRFDDAVWVSLWGGELLKFNSEGVMLMAISVPRPWGVCVSPHDRTVWVAEYEGAVRRFSPSGIQQLYIPAPEQLPECTNPGQSCGQTWLAIGPAPLLPNNPPIADASLTPDTVISPNNVNARVVLDGSASSDPEGATLNFSWYAKPEMTLLGEGSKIALLEELGRHTITLLVDDGQDTATTSVTLEVITAAQAVEILAQHVGDSKLNRHRKRPFVATLNAAVTSFDRREFNAGLNQLRAFQNKVRAQVAQVDAQLAEDLIAAAQAIIDALTTPEPEPIPNMVWIEPGTFMMGSPETEAERRDDETLHEVTISRGFWMGKYEVTQGEYLEVVGSNPSFFRNGTPPYAGGTGGRVTNELAHPVESVNWNDATSYCALLTKRERDEGRLPDGYVYRLPTESEWEYACRAGTTTTCHYGEGMSSDLANFYGRLEYHASVGTLENPAGVYLGRTTEVGRYEPNAWGLYDMHGNAWEWCQDRYGAYHAWPMTDPTGSESGWGRIHRGGSWSNDGWGCRSADRHGEDPEDRDNSFGFRVVLGHPYPLE